MSSTVFKRRFQKTLGERESKTISLPSRNNNNNKINVIEDTKLPEDRRNITELLNIQIIQNGKIIGVCHLPEEVIVRLHSKTVEIYDEYGSLIETYDLVTRNLSWLENTYADSSEIILDLHVKT